MSADIQTGQLTDWYNSQPYQGVMTSGFHPGYLTCWYNAKPYQFMVPSGGASNYFFFFN